MNRPELYQDLNWLKTLDDSFQTVAHKDMEIYASLETVDFGIQHSELFVGNALQEEAFKDLLEPSSFGIDSGYFIGKNHSERSEAGSFICSSSFYS